jgi:hypothetical protein
MNTLELNQMEIIEAGNASCYWALAGLLVVGLSVGVVTGGVGIALWAAGATTGLGGAVTSCT